MQVALTRTTAEIELMMTKSLLGWRAEGTQVVVRFRLIQRGTPKAQINQAGSCEVIPSVERQMLADSTLRAGILFFLFWGLAHKKTVLCMSIYLFVSIVAPILTPF